MAHQVRTIDQHPDRDRIIEALLAGEPLRKVAKLAGISHQAVSNYKRQVVKPAVRNATKTLQRNNVPPEVTEQVQQTAALTRQAVEQNPVLSRVIEKFTRYDRWFQGAESKEDFRSCASIDGAETKALELQARLLGLLDSGPSVTNNVLVLGLPPDQARAALPAPAADVIDVEPVE